MTEYLVPSLYSSLNSPGRRILSRFGNVRLPFILARSLRVTYYALILCRPFFLLLLRMFLPALVFILLRNPCFRFLRRFEGRKVGCMKSSLFSKLVTSSRCKLFLARIIASQQSQVKEFLLLPTDRSRGLAFPLLGNHRTRYNGTRAKGKSRMATREMWIERKQGRKEWYCAFRGPGEDTHAAARRNMRFSNHSLLAAGLVGLTTLAFYRIPQLKDLPYSERVIDTAALVALAILVLQIAARSNVKIEYRGNDGLVCVVANARFSFSGPPSFLVEIPESDVEIALRFSRKGDATAQIAGKTVFKSQAQARHPGFVVRTPPLHVDFEDYAGYKATLDGSHGKRGRYRLVYDEEFDFQWLLLVVVAMLLLR